jgi:hypothetical protein
VSMTQTNELASWKSLRLWPGVVLAIGLVVALYLVPTVAPDAEIMELSVSLLGIFAGMLCAVAIVLWWMLFSRAPWSDRFFALLVMVVAIVAIKLVVHPSIAGGAQGYMAYALAFPTMTLGLAAAAAAGRHLTGGLRRVAVIVGIMVGCGIWTLARTDGLTDLEWRWTPTAEERLLAQAANEPPLPSPAVAAEIAKGSTALAPVAPAPVAPAPAPAAPAPAAPIPPVPPATPTLAAIARAKLSM